MSTEMLLQILVFPAIGAVWWKLSLLESRLAAGEERFRSAERRLDTIELRCERNHNQ